MSGVLEDLRPRFLASIDAAGVSTRVLLVDATWPEAGDLMYVSRTGEQMRVSSVWVAVGGFAICVDRGLASVALPLQAGEELMRIGEVDAPILAQFGRLMSARPWWRRWLPWL